MADTANPNARAIKWRELDAPIAEYADVHHGGNFSEAARELAGAGLEAKKGAEGYEPVREKLFRRAKESS